MNKNSKIITIALLLGAGMTVFAQEAKDEKPVYQFTETVNVPAPALTRSIAPPR